MPDSSSGPHSSKGMAQDKCEGGRTPIAGALPAEWDERFRPRFAARVRQTLQAIADYIVIPSAETRAAMADTVHKLVGIAGALGRTEVSDRVRQLDIALTAGALPAIALIAQVVDVLGAELASDAS